jgi:hypothetical protein
MTTFFPELVFFEKSKYNHGYFKYYLNFMKKGRIKMEALKNLPTENPKQLTSLITSKKNQIKLRWVKQL